MKTECNGDYVKLKGKTYPCTVSLTMDLIGGKWKAVILYHLKDEPKRYSELRKEIPSVTEMTLSLQLKQLEKDGLISRKLYGKKPPIKVVYSLTDLGNSFVPLLEAITEWGNQVILEKGEFLISEGE
ncbi:helix-turn-helix transcriptional regulator [Chryseobacterium chendengshani]|uniref:winged helix-turn-helix transcriptional regulator n=1 Tax=Chryseobacterium sp. LJ668 TaxID=2864040 RepID=UPI001C68C986|nr:helix-turn-helix domain-containing protein [Chryseobacterium sp. LJ668]MBW8523517.1 helix-turn-helix transcriptional regulator [Chryseobacterium sp. LJ668]QYK15800.1 helix-turn-helix transcriptional regulator [Chryseobacterium sp. LJ668]